MTTVTTTAGSTIEIETTDRAVLDYETNASCGVASTELAEQSDAEGVTGAVPANLLGTDEAGRQVWGYVAPSQVSLYRSSLAETVITVYVVRPWAIGATGSKP